MNNRLIFAALLFQRAAMKGVVCLALIWLALLYRAHSGDADYAGALLTGLAIYVAGMAALTALVCLALWIWKPDYLQRLDSLRSRHEIGGLLRPARKPPAKHT
jgi:hypothetical protein